MKRMPLIIMLTILAAANLQAQKKTFTRDYTYQASEDDSRNSARANATTQMRNILLREVGEFLHTERRLYQDNTSHEYVEKIEAITAGIIEMKMLDEQWNGVTYYIKAEMTVDPKDLESRIADVLNDKQKTKELEESRKRIRDAEAEVEKLKKELANSDSRNNQALRSAYQYQTGILAANEYITRGNIALSNGWSEEAIAEYDKAYAQMPKNDATYLFMGDVYRKVDDGRSFGCYKKYLNNNPNDCEMLIHVVDIYNRHARKEYDRKQKECSNCIILYMPNPYYEKAEQCYKQIIMSDPDNADAYMKLAKLCHKIDRRDEATKYMGKAIELVPNDADADVYYRMGDECFIQRNFSQAIWCYEKTMAIDPNNAELYYKMGNVYGDLKKKKDKVKYYQKAAQLGHEDAQKWLQDNKYKW